TRRHTWGSLACNWLERLAARTDLQPMLCASGLAQALARLPQDCETTSDIAFQLRQEEGSIGFPFAHRPRQRSPAPRATPPHGNEARIRAPPILGQPRHRSAFH